MHNQPKISIIVPVYNTEKYLTTCLDSLINQTLKDIEIICVNDGSTDDSLKILKEYARKDSRIKILSKENEGLSAARNDGLRAASGDYIGFVDSDDWIDLDFYEKLYTAAAKYNSEAACANIMRFGKNKEKHRLKYVKEEFFTDNEAKLKAAGIPLNNYVWNKIYKKESLVKLDIPFIEGKAYEDIPWSIRVIYGLKGLVTVPDTNYYYRRTSSSIRLSKKQKYNLDCEYGEKIMIDFAMKNGLDNLLRGYKMSKRERIRFCNINLLKIFYYYPDVKLYKLFGLIPVLKTKVK